MAEREHIMARTKNQESRKSAPGHAEKQKSSSRLKMATLKDRDRSPRSVLATAFGGLLVVLLISGLMLMVMIGHRKPSSATASNGPSQVTTVPIGYGSLNHVKGPCGNNAQQPACPTPQLNWNSVTSESPASVTKSIEQDVNYISMQSRFGYTSLDTPILVHAFDAHTGISYYDDDHWIVSVRNASGMRCGIFDYVYDRANHRMSFSSYGVITPVDPHHTLAFPYVSATTAIQALWNQRGLQVKAGVQPELIFFPINPSFPILTSPISKWMGGGNSPMLPMWLLVGSDGRNYFVGTDLSVYAQSTLPIATGRP
jgi:hypothetical protein